MSNADVLACRQILRQGSRSFHAASLLLPHRVGDAASALYAFCRLADNAVDHPSAPGPVVSGLEARLGAVYSDDHLAGSVDRAFRDVVKTHEIPRAVPEALLEGLRWDEAGRTYSDISDLYDYGVRVGSTVGVMMTLVMGRRDAETLTAASELGLAMHVMRANLHFDRLAIQESATQWPGCSTTLTDCTRGPGRESRGFRRAAVPRSGRPRCCIPKSGTRSDVPVAIRSVAGRGRPG